VEPFVGRASTVTIAAGIALILLGGCTRPDSAEVSVARCSAREIRHAGVLDGSLSSAVARQAAENQSYRECMERRSVRVAR
jgi:hypothetical protein